MLGTHSSLKAYLLGNFVGPLPLIACLGLCNVSRETLG